MILLEGRARKENQIKGDLESYERDYADRNFEKASKKKGERIARRTEKGELDRRLLFLIQFQLA